MMLNNTMQIARAANLPTIYRALFFGDAVAFPLILYALGFPTVGGALLLSSVVVFAVAIIRSGALATSWLGNQTLKTIEKAIRFELAKALVCAGLAVDVLFGGARLINHYHLWHHGVSLVVVFTAAGLLAIASGLFFTRWFAGYLFSQR